MFNFLKRFHRAQPIEDEKPQNISDLTKTQAVVDMYNAMIAKYEGRIQTLENDIAHEAEYTARLEDLLIMYTQKAIDDDEILDRLYEEYQARDYSCKINNGEY